MIGQEEEVGGGEKSQNTRPPPPRPARLSPAPPGCSARCPLLGVPLPVARLWHRTCLGGTKQSLPAAAPCCPPAPPPPCSLPRSPSAALIRPTLIWVCFFSPRVGRVVPVCSLAVIFFFSPLHVFCCSQFFNCCEICAKVLRGLGGWVKWGRMLLLFLFCFFGVHANCPNFAPL